jgi:hypothetical protein
MFQMPLGQRVRKLTDLELARIINMIRENMFVIFRDACLLVVIRK